MLLTTLKVFVLAGVGLSWLFPVRLDNGTLILSQASAAGPEFLATQRPRPARLVESTMPADQMRARLVPADQLYPFPKLEQLRVVTERDGSLGLAELPKIKSVLAGRLAGVSQNNDLVYLSLDPRVQAIAESVVRKTSAPHVAVVAMEPRTGKILGIADRSSLIADPATHSGFPAASIFKIVTAAAALEQSDLRPNDLIAYRGGNYTLDNSNYLPSKKTDRRAMTLTDALGKSVNPVFGRVALLYLNSGVLSSYADRFGFNAPLPFQFPLNRSTASVPENGFGLSRTAAGFGAVTLSPVHAAALMAGIANGGLLPRPVLIEQIVTRAGYQLYEAAPQSLKRMVQPATAATLLRMMESTTTSGTSMREFVKNRKPVLPGISVAAKTGTLRGKNPAGLNTWFVAAAPSDAPEVALAVIVVNPSNTSSRASGVGRRFLEQFFSPHKN